MEIVLKNFKAPYSNNLEFVFNESESSLNVFFSGNPSKKELIKIDDIKIVNAVKQYLNDERYVYLQKDISRLDFGTLEIFLRDDILIFSSKRQSFLPILKKFKVYASSDLDLILWTIVNAKEDFNLFETRKEIMGLNGKFREFRLDQLKKMVS